jgi:hypothetical protein
MERKEKEHEYHHNRNFIFDDSIEQVFWVSLVSLYTEKILILFLTKNSKVSGNFISFSSVLVSHSITIKQRSPTKMQN